MRRTNLRGLAKCLPAAGGVVLSVCVALITASPVNATDVAEAGGQTLGTAQLIPTPGTGNPTIVKSGISGDAIHVQTSIINIVGGVRQQETVAGATASGQYTMASHAAAPFAGSDSTARQYSDNTFTTEIFFDDDDSAGNYAGFLNSDGTTANADGTINLEWGDFGDDGDVDFGYTILDIAQYTNFEDYFRVEGLLPGSTLSAETYGDGSTFGFHDSIMELFDSAGGSLDANDDKGGSGIYNFSSGMSRVEVVVPADGIVDIGLATYNGAGGTYEMIVIGTEVPEPSSLLLLGLGGIALVMRRRR